MIRTDIEKKIDLPDGFTFGGMDTPKPKVLDDDELREIALALIEAESIERQEA